MQGLSHVVSRTQCKKYVGLRIKFYVPDFSISLIIYIYSVRNIILKNSTEIVFLRQLAVKTMNRGRRVHMSQYIKQVF